MRNVVTRSYVAKKFQMVFYYDAKGFNNVIKTTIYTSHWKLKIVTFKLNVTKYISLKIYCVVMFIWAS